MTKELPNSTIEMKNVVQIQILHQRDQNHHNHKEPMGSKVQPMSIHSGSAKANPITPLIKNKGRAN